MNFIKKIIRFRKVHPLTKNNKDLIVKLLDNSGDLFNELYYVYKEKYEEETGALNKKYIEKFDYTKLRLTDDYLYESEEEKEQTDKKPTKSDMNEFIDFIFYREMGINKELFQKKF